jgi:hypothetical protein
MVAWSPFETGVRLTASTAGVGGTGREGSGLMLGLGVIGPGWLGFHIALKVIPFLS